MNGFPNLAAHVHAPFKTVALTGRNEYGIGIGMVRDLSFFSSACTYNTHTHTCMHKSCPTAPHPQMSGTSLGCTCAPSSACLSSLRGGCCTAFGSCWCWSWTWPTLPLSSRTTKHGQAAVSRPTPATYASCLFLQIGPMLLLFKALCIRVRAHYKMERHHRALVRRVLIPLFSHLQSTTKIRCLWWSCALASSLCWMWG